MTFEEWRAKREWTANASELIDPDSIKIHQGFLYPDGSVIIMGYNEPNNWYTVCGRDEVEDLDLTVVEHFLWENHAKDNVS